MDLDEHRSESELDLIPLLKSAGIRHEFHLPDGAHSWPIWRDYLTRFASRLFR